MKAFHTLVAKSTEALIQLDDKSFPEILPMKLQSYFDEELEKEWKGPFTFIQMADPQFGLIEKFILKKEVPHWEEEMALTTAAIKCINKMRPKPRFVVICGDMLDAHPNQPDEIKVREEQYEDFVEVFQQLDPEIPLICVCGNHDICDEPTPLSYIIYKKQFGPDFFSFWVGGVKFVVLNSQYFKKPGCLPKRTAKQLEFLRNIQDKNAKHLVVFQHIPFFVSHPNEQDVSYLNIEKENRFEIMDLIDQQGVQYVFCGHYHRNGGGRYKNFDQVVTSALGGPFGDDPSGFRICHVTEHGIFHQYVPVIVENSKILKSVPHNKLPATVSRHHFLKFLSNLNPILGKSNSANKKNKQAKNEKGEDDKENLDVSVFQPPSPPEPHTLQELLTIRLFHTFSKAFATPKYWR
jgi:predicted MPP superfamily phosphohydrolase